MAIHYRVDWVFRLQQEPLHDAVLVVEAGQTVEVKPRRNERVDVDLGPSLVLPRFINAHTHLDLGVLRGKLPAPASFTSWLQSVIQYRRTSTPAEWDVCIEEGIRESWAAGTGFVGDISVGGRSAKLLAQSPLAASRVYLELIGLSHERIDQAIIDAQGWLSTNQQSWPMHCLSPHAPYTVGRTMLQRLAQFTPRVAMHVAETQEEVELLNHRTGPFVEFLKQLNVWHPHELCSSMDELLHLLMTSFKHLTLVHGNYLTRDQWQRFPVLKVVYCPRTHAYFGHQPHPYLDMLADGVFVQLGTDSLASNPSLSILEEARYLWHRDRIRLDGPTLLQLACGMGNNLDPFIVLPHAGDSSDPWDLLWSGSGTPQSDSPLFQW